MVRVLPSTRACTGIANAEGTSTIAATTAARTERRRDTNPPSARGSISAAGGRSSDSGLPPAPPSRPCGQWHFGAGASPLTAAGPSPTCTRFPCRSPLGPEPNLALVQLRRPPWLWAPAGLWAAVLFACSSVPDLGAGLGTWDTVLRKCAHASEYAVLALLLYRAIGRELPAFLIGLAYAVTDGLHQEFVRGRHASPFDVSMDAAGLALGLLLLHTARWRWASVQSNRG